MANELYSFRCELTRRRVTVCVTSYDGIGGIGDTKGWSQDEHCCEYEDECPAIESNQQCPIRLKNTGEG